MASTPTGEASEVRRRGRQRLIGAIALVAVLVVFVPMILDSEPRKTQERADLAIPPKDNAPPLPAPPASAKAPEAVTPATSPVTPAKAGAQSDAVTPAKAGAQAQTATVTPTPSPRDPSPEPSKAPDKAAKAAPTPAKATPAAATPAAAPKLEGFAVQVGAFRDEAKLDQARQKLTAAKVPHYTERLEAKGGPLTRLRAGPFATREAAESALATLKRSALDGKVVPLP